MAGLIFIAVLLSLRLNFFWFLLVNLRRLVVGIDDCAKQFVHLGVQSLSIAVLGERMNSVIAQIASVATPCQSKPFWSGHGPALLQMLRGV
ncbi:hypothetical protein NMG46_16050 [Mesorhizobium sp. LMG 17147]|uniref:hypothetical protein n=1 Tax=Mesorhizobium sp. LMG 17147 TaxID=2963091 RepID=UPI0020C988A7|nr:hypothetical protein [Mesorhizobium sp. LMG 17147]MCP9231753.1 hypothetical protein [Mesorhizobium sp. LMG 17147]